jgi:hypothetical protein
MMCCAPPAQAATAAMNKINKDHLNVLDDSDQE